MICFAYLRSELSASKVNNKVDEFISKNLKKIIEYMVIDYHNCIDIFLPHFSSENSLKVANILANALHNKYAIIGPNKSIKNKHWFVYQYITPYPDNIWTKFLSNDIIRRIINKKVEEIKFISKELSIDSLQTNNWELILAKSKLYLLTHNEILYIFNLIKDAIDHNYNMLNIILNIYRYSYYYSKSMRNMLCEILTFCIGNIRNFDFTKINVVDKISAMFIARKSFDIATQLMAEAAEILIAFSGADDIQGLVLHLESCNINVLNKERWFKEC